MRTPSVEGILTARDLEATAKTIAEWQLPSGMIPWFPGGHSDPWNHIESAMALATCGLLEQAESAYGWLRDVQRPDGSWHNYYLADGIEDSKLDTNCVAYIATGVWHHYLATGNRTFLQEYWPIVDSAIEFVLGMQTRRGEIIWARHVDERPWDYALLTGSSSISHSLACAAKIAAALGQEQNRWLNSRDRLVKVIATQPEAFEPKKRWAMDWYYPVLSGAVHRGSVAYLKEGWDKFAMEGRGIRCVADQPWVTAAETCECAIAHLVAGQTKTALDLFTWTQELRDEEGRYYTGFVFPDGISYPDKERSTYSAAAVVLAADALFGHNPTSDLFTGLVSECLSDSAEDTQRTRG